MDLAALEARITRIEDLESIKQLKARYCEVRDNDHNFHGDVFTKRMGSVLADQPSLPMCRTNSRLRLI